MVSTLKIVIGVIVIAVCVTALILGIVLGTRNYGSCDSVAAPTGLNFKLNEDYSVDVSWEDVERSEGCEVTYMFNYKVDDTSPAGSQVNTTELKHTVGGLQPCTTLTVSIYAIGDSGEPSAELSDEFTVEPNVLAAPSSVMFSIVGSNLFIVWHKPESLSKCDDLTYQITVDTDKDETASVPVNANTHTIAYDSFCLKFDVRIATTYNGVTGAESEWSYDDSSDVLGIEISDRVEGSNELTVRWTDHPKAEECSLSYTVTHRIGEVDTPLDVEDGASEASFSYAFCEVAYIIFKINREGETAEEFEEDVTQLPNEDELVAPSNVEFSIADANLNMLWVVPESLSKCEDLTYQITVATDRDETESSTIDTTTHSIGYDSFCLKADVSISSVYDSIIGNPAEWSFSDSRDHLNIEISDRVEGSDELTVTWTDHPKAEECALSYTVVHRIGNQDTPLDVEDGAFQASFSFVLCEVAYIAIIINKEDETAEEIVEEVTQLNADEVPAPSDPVFSIVGDNLMIAWDAPESLSRCQGLSYRISITTDKDDIEPVTVDTNSHSISYDSFCLSVDFKIATIYNEETGDEDDWSYSDSSEVLNVEISDRVEGSDEITVTWTDHPKAEECSISYTVVYRFDGQDILLYFEDGEDGALEARFPFVICEIASIVVIINKEDVRIEEIVEDVTQYPTSDDIGVLNGVSMQPGADETGLVLSWDEKTIGQCAVTYEIEFQTDLTDVENKYTTAQSSYAVPDNIYCYNLGANVYGVINEDSEDRIVGAATELVSQGYEISSVNDLDVSVDAGSLRVTWTEHPKKTLCSLEYLVEFSYDDGEDIIIADTLETTETELYWDISLPYCVEIDVSVKAFNSEHDDWIASHASQLITPSPETLGSVSNIQVNAATGEITWEGISDVERCADLQYAIVLTTDDGSTATGTATTNFFVIPDDITYCFSLTVEITPTYGNIRGTPVTETYGENVTPDELPAPSSMLFSVANGNLIMDWAVPQSLSSCEGISYQINVATDKGDLQPVTVDVNTHSIGYDSFCLEAEISISTVYNGIIGSPSPWLYSDSSDALNIEISARDSNELTVTWTNHPKTEECSLSYSVVHRVGEVDSPLDVEDGAFEVSFPYELCEVAFIIIIIHQEDGTTVEVVEDVTQYPTSDEIGAVSGLSIQRDADGTGLVLSWDEKTIGKCVVTYQIEFTTDVADVENEYSTAESPYVIPNNIYCYYLGASVYGVINRDSEDRIVGVAGVLVSQGYDISPVSDLSVSTVSGGLRATWTEHPKKTLCSLEYLVEYSYEDGEDNVVDGAETAETEFDLDISMAYCVEIDVSVTAFNSEHVDWIATSATQSITSWPETLGTVSNIQVDATTGEITWDEISSVDRCADLQYRIEFTLDDGSTYMDTSTTNSYIIPDDITYCFSLSFTITPILGGIEGIPFAYNYDENAMSAVSDLIYEVTATGELQVTWSRHAKETDCGLQYRVTYTATDQVPQSDDTASNTINFDYIFCSTGTVSVVTFDGSDNLGATATIALDAQGPPASYVATSTVTVVKVGTENVEGTVSWSDVEIGICSVTYYIEVISATTDTYSNVVSPMNFEIEDYCLTLQARLIPIVNGISLTPIESNVETFELSAVSDLTYEVTAAEELQVTWSRHAKETYCGLQYRVTYTATDQVPQSDDTASNSINFDYIFCSTGTISVVTFDGSDNLGATATIALDAEGPPASYVTTSTVTVVKVGTENVAGTVAWSDVEIGICSVTYDIEVISATTDAYSNVVSPLNFEIEDYCLTLQARLTPVVNGVSLTPILSNIETFELAAVSDLEAERSSNALIVTWTRHPKEEECGLSYRVYYYVDDVLDDAFVAINPTHTFEYVHCAVGLVTVTPLRSEYLALPAEVAVPNEGVPSSVGVVRAIALVDGGEGTATVTWVAPLYVSKCTEIVYTVTVTSADGNNSDTVDCLITETCTVELPDFCSATVTVEATSVQGTPASITYTCPISTEL